MGGTDDETNLIKVNVAMHAFLHEQLYRDYGRIEDYAAWQGLSGNKEAIKSLGSTGFKGRKHTDKSKNKISESMPYPDWKPWLHTESNRNAKKRLEAVRALVNEGKTPKEISEESGIPLPSVYRLRSNL